MTSFGQWTAALLVLEIGWIFEQISIRVWWYDMTDLRYLKRVITASWPGDLSKTARSELLALYRHVAYSPQTLAEREFDPRPFPPSWTERDAAGSIVGVAGLTRVPTLHRITAGARGCYGWCAWDCLFLAEILATELRFESPCPSGAGLVSMTVSANGIESMQPDTAHITFALADASGFSNRLREVFCAHVRACSDPRAAMAFCKHEPTRVAISAHEAYELGRHRNRIVFGDLLH